MALTPVLAELTFDDAQDAAAAPLRIGRYFVEEGLSRPFRVELEVTVPAARGSATTAWSNPEAWLGRAASFILTRQLLAARSWNGIICSCSVVASGLGAVRLRLTLVPRLELLRHDVGSEIYVEHTVRQLLEQLVGPTLGPDCALSFLLRDADALEVKVERRIRFRESRLDFFHRLLRDFGLGYWLAAEEEGKEPEARQTLFIFDDPTLLGGQRQQGKVSLPLEPSGTLAVESLQGLISCHTLGPQEVQVQSLDPTQPKEAGNASAQLPLPHSVFGVHTELSSQLRHSFEGKAFGQSWAEQRAQTLAKEHISGTYAGTSAAGNALALLPGHLLHIEPRKAGPTGASEYGITAMEHSGDGGHLAAVLGPKGDDSAEAPEAYGNRLELTLAQGLWQRAYLLPPPVPMGVHSAQVLGRADDDDAPYVDDAGRILVQIVGIRHTVPPGTQRPEGIWVRATQLWAGAGVGAFFWPRPGMEVLVGFMGAHDEEPVLLGSAYNGSNRPPYPVTMASRSGIKTHLEGNELCFQDAPGREEILLEAKRALRIDVHEIMSTQVGFAKAWRRWRAAANKVAALAGNSPDREFRSVPPESRRMLFFALDRIEEGVTKAFKGGSGLCAPSWEDKEALARAVVDILESQLVHLSPATRHMVQSVLAKGHELYSLAVDLADPNDRLISRTSIFGRAMLQVTEGVTAKLKKKLDLHIGDSLHAAVKRNVDLEAGERAQVAVRRPGALTATEGAAVSLTPDSATTTADKVALEAGQRLRLKQQLASVLLEHSSVSVSAEHIGARAQKQHLEAEQELVLQQGKCTIKVHDDKIEISAPKIELAGDEVKIRGRRSLTLKSPKTAID